MYKQLFFKLRLAQSPFIFYEKKGIYQQKKKELVLKTIELYSMEDIKAENILAKMDNDDDALKIKMMLIMINDRECNLYRDKWLYIPRDVEKLVLPYNQKKDDISFSGIPPISNMFNIYKARDVSFSTSKEYPHDFVWNR